MVRGDWENLAEDGKGPADTALEGMVKEAFIRKISGKTPTGVRRSG